MATRASSTSPATRTRAFTRVAIANRGEAASRCIRAVDSLAALEDRRLETLALYTEVDSSAPFVRHASEALLLPAMDPVAAYLDADALVAAARAGGADALWPGWGFLSEDAEFATAVQDAGLVWIGPDAAAIRALGDKIAAKTLAERCQVPVAAWSRGPVPDREAALRWADRIGFPLVVKATAGGGGRGIRTADDRERLPAAFEEARSEARAASGSEIVFLERKIARGRHIEVQIAADAHGWVASLGCRDCSVQRRHQKVVEETPPPGLSPGLRTRMEQASIRLAREAGYLGVGTAEFLVDGDEIYFVEMNPRLQVEHGITEELTGVDLVALQLRIARGDSLAGLDFRETGHVIEARVCAEDAQADFAPSPGRVSRFDPPVGPGLRIDTGIVQGSEVPAAFDSLVAKVMARGPTRDAARSRLRAALASTDLVIEGGATNRAALCAILDADAFRRGAVDMHWLDAWSGPGDDPAGAADALAAAAVVVQRERRTELRHRFFREPTRLAALDVPAARGTQIELSRDGRRVTLHVLQTGADRYVLAHEGQRVEVRWRDEGCAAGRICVNGHWRRVTYDLDRARVRVELGASSHVFGLTGAGEVHAATSGIVVSLAVSAGEHVGAGQRLGMLEAMKLEFGFDSPVDGMVRRLAVGEGQRVAAGDILAVIEPSGWIEADTSERGPQLPAGGDPVAEWLAAPASLPGPSQLAALDREIASALRGFDVDPRRLGEIAARFASGLRASRGAPCLGAVSSVTRALAVFADVEALFSRTADPGTGPTAACNDSGLRDYLVHWPRSRGDTREDFRVALSAGLSHLGVALDDPRDEVEAALIRLLAARAGSPDRARLVHALLRYLAATAAAKRGEEADALEGVLLRVAELRERVGDPIADAALEAHYERFEGPALERDARATTRAALAWLRDTRDQPRLPSRDVLHELASAPHLTFAAIAGWAADPDDRRRSLLLMTHLWRLYAPNAPVFYSWLLRRDVWIDRFDLGPGRSVVGTIAPVADAAKRTDELLRAAASIVERDPLTRIESIELVVPLEGEVDREAVFRWVAAALRGELRADRFTVTLLESDGSAEHRTFEPGPRGPRERADLLGLHPTTARRLRLVRLRAFSLERLPAPEPVLLLRARSRSDPEDERLIAIAEVRGRAIEGDAPPGLHEAAFDQLFAHTCQALRTGITHHDPRRRLHWNRLELVLTMAVAVEPDRVAERIRHLAPMTRHLGLEAITVRAEAPLDADGTIASAWEIELRETADGGFAARRVELPCDLAPASARDRGIAEARRRGVAHPSDVLRVLSACGPDAAESSFERYAVKQGRPLPLLPGEESGPCGVMFGVISTPTAKVPEGMRRVLVLADPTCHMGSFTALECDQLVAAFDLAERLQLPVEWFPVSSGARIAFDSGTENLDASARVARRIVEFVARDGVVNLVVDGVNVGAQSYFDALASMLPHTRGALIMTPRGSMVLTGRAALAASGGVAAEDEVDIGGFERVMGPNGEAQYWARDLPDAVRILHAYYETSYVVPGEDRPRPRPTRDPRARSIATAPYPAGSGAGPDATGVFRRIGDLFDERLNPGRKRPFAMRPLMRALADADSNLLERWQGAIGGETAIVCDTHLGGFPICLIGIESQNVPRRGAAPFDGPNEWTGGTLFPRSSKKVARALRAASGNRPIVILANLSGFDGSPESLRHAQLEWGAEIARAVVEFDGPILFTVVSRYHGGAYVVFSRALNPSLRAFALRGAYASVIGGGPAARVVFGREVRGRASADPRIAAARAGPRAEGFEVLWRDVLLEMEREVAAEFDAIHTVERAREVGSIDAIIEPDQLRPVLIDELERTRD